MGKIFVTGPGRSGSTAIVQILTRLGMDTGFEAYEEPVRDDLRAGCEYSIAIDFDRDTRERLVEKFSEAPRILKGPEWSLVLKQLLVYRVVEVDAVLLPLRDLEVSAVSRLDVGLDWGVAPEMRGEQAVKAQAHYLAAALGRTIEACFLYSIPCTIVGFPKFAEDWRYCYGKLDPVVDTSPEEFRSVWEDTIDRERIEWSTERVQPAK